VTRILASASWYMSVASITCLIVAILAFPAAPIRADEPDPTAPGHCANSACTVTCGPGIYPLCGTGKCNKLATCPSTCTCQLLTQVKLCECTTGG
jgi:hypothetical protein